MARLVQLWACVTCGTEELRGFDAPTPQHCHLPMRWRQTRTYQDPPNRFGQSAAIDFRNTSPWEVPLNGIQSVSSLREVRKIERDAEQSFRNGEGQELHFRAFSQDRGNLDTNTFGSPPQRAPSLFRNGKQILSVTSVAGEEADVPMGPGADEARASALALDPH